MLQREQEMEIRSSKRHDNVLYSYVLRDWHVSTCYRRASTQEESWFYETFIWHQPNKDIERELVGDATEMGHWEACEWILKNNGWLNPQPE